MAITWDQIGSEYFIALAGELDPIKATLREITRPSVDGRAFRQEGDRSTIFELRGIRDVASGSAADTLITTYKAMIGSTVSIVLRGQTRANYLVVDVETVSRKAVTSSAGGVGVGTGAYLVESRWTLTRSGTS